jgi:hypothetical protein
VVKKNFGPWKEEVLPEKEEVLPEKEEVCVHIMMLDRNVEMRSMMW